ncbi:uncharacterized protein LOC108668209 [Hyalella azteca]|uniref:Uncharacterized protein LOC108668209 n=1 Tax=Hyalella azteca TaxID=294128 RepID=A0A8B7NBE2_HYAAZ|nr:uncharacterized protein LOC108668209 [Hyalella azteca]
MEIAPLLASAILTLVEAIQETSYSYAFIPVAVEQLLAIGVASKNYSDVNVILCSQLAALDGIAYPTLCVHSTSGQCLLLNSTYPALFNRTYSRSRDYNCYIGQEYKRSKVVAIPCPATFDWVEDVGCVVVVKTAVTYDVAQASCPGGSQLVSLYADNFQKLAGYVYRTSFVPSGKSSDLYHVGVHRYNLVWTWRTGQVMSGVPGTAP